MLMSPDIKKWNYKYQKNVSHLGAVAEDSYEAFELGDNNKSILTIDSDGVMMLATLALKSANDMLRSKLEKQEQIFSEILKKLE